jgi:hypothetical protein
MSDDLIDRLAAEATPVPRNRLPLLLGLAVGVGAVIAMLVMIPWLGLRPDLMEATGTMIFWWKFTYTALFAAIALWATIRLARPGGSMRRPMLGLFALIAFAGALGIAQLVVMPPAMSYELVMGGTALVCPLYIVGLAVPVYAATALIMRRLAPTNLAAAGFAAGLLAGSAAAWVYAFHCGENGMPFLAIWYTTGILIAAGLGAILGRWALRW